MDFVESKPVVVIADLPVLGRAADILPMGIR